MDTADFNPRSREGSDKLKQRVLLSRMDFNPLSRKGSDIMIALLFLLIFKFQSALPRGERPLPGGQNKKGHQKFQSALPRGERLR